MIKILIVEDEEAIANLIRINLVKAGYQCEIASDGEEAADAIAEHPFDLILLDIMLPKLNGYEVLEYAKTVDVPVIFLTAMGETAQKVKGLKLGAEDYIAKPFEIAELLARVETVLRRYHKTERRIRILDIEIDTDSRTVTQNGREVDLTIKEFDLLLLFVRNKNSEWYSCHLLPEHPFPISYSDKGEDLAWGVSLDAYVKIDAGVIPVRALVRVNNAEDAVEIAILDQSNDFLYYAGIISDEMLLYSFQVLGVESEDELDQKLWDGTYSLDMVRDSSWYDYASACGANSQEIETTDPTGIFQKVTLRYEEFDVSAFRTMFQNDWGSGLQTMFGTQKWEEIAVSIATMYTGYAVNPVSEEEWLDTWNEEMVYYGRGDLLIMQYGLEPAEVAPCEGE